MEKVSRAIFAVKPDGIHKEIYGHSVPCVIQGLLCACSLSIIQETHPLLGEDAIRSIYPILNIPDQKYGEQWKIDLIRHISSEPLIAYLIQGCCAEEKAKTIKLALRDALTDKTTERGRVIENIAHVSDKCDFEATYKAMLFTR